MVDCAELAFLHIAHEVSCDMHPHAHNWDNTDRQKVRAKLWNMLPVLTQRDRLVGEGVQSVFTSHYKTRRLRGCKRATQGVPVTPRIVPLQKHAKVSCHR